MRSTHEENLQFVQRKKYVWAKAPTVRLLSVWDLPAPASGKAEPGLHGGHLRSQDTDSTAPGVGRKRRAAPSTHGAVTLSDELTADTWALRSSWFRPRSVWKPNKGAFVRV